MTTQNGSQTPRMICQDGRCLIWHECHEVGQFTNIFLEQLRVRGLSGNTVKAYGYDLVYWFRWLKANELKIFTFSRQSLFEYTKYQVDSRAKPKSINRRLIVCELFLQFLQERSVSIHETHTAKKTTKDSRWGQGFWPRNQGVTSLRVKIPQTIVEPLDVKEINQFMTDVRHYRDLSIILLMVLVGLRRCEVLAIDIADMDFENRILRIQGKGKKERIMPLPDMVMKALKKYLEYERPRQAQSKRVFTLLQGDRRGEAMTGEGLRSFFRRKRISSKIFRANPHRLRHSFAYSMIHAGVSVVVLQKMLGHARYTTTLQYIALKPEDISEQYLKAMEVIEKRHVATHPTT